MKLILEEVKKLFRVKSKEREILLNNINNIKRQKLIQQVIKELSEDWAKDLSMILPLPPRSCHVLHGGNQQIH